MFEKLTNADERGQVGIETLIIFIAMILVAAIAAGILINTAGFLQNKASSTSQDSTEQVSNQIVVISAIGNVSSNENVADLNFTTMQSPGADEIDLREMTIEWVGPSGHDTLIYENASVENVSGGNFTAVGVKDSDDSNPVLNAKSDRIVIHVPLGATGTPGQLDGGEEATVRFVTQSGSMYTYVVNVPESLASDQGSSVSV